MDEIGELRTQLKEAYAEIQQLAGELAEERTLHEQTIADRDTARRDGAVYALELAHYELWTRYLPSPQSDFVYRMAAKMRDGRLVVPSDYRSST